MSEMNITSVEYVRMDGEIDHIKTVIDGKTYAVPLTAGNRHYAEIMRQVNAGTLTIQDAD